MTNKYDLLVINTDGGARGNPGPAGIGVSAVVNKEVIFTVSQKIGITTNNVAEYTAVIKALEEIEKLQISAEKIKFILDSELIVNQILGNYKVKQPHLQVLRQTVIDLIKKLRTNNQVSQISFTSVPREENKSADKLVNLALDS